ncbi:uncharacterized protein [Dermacentor albipictus]|uniref:uncharacterized protein n=1 Tax=Dermacentor albipictus TaxID=60249 RepID=UPI0038FC1617
MQGGRRKEKWAEIEEQLHREQIGVYAVTETHLRDSEEPPVIENYVWEGCNRTKSERKGGGVGMLIHQGAKRKRVNSQCQEHLWLSGTMSGKETWLGVTYLWTGINCTEKNKELVECISADIRGFENGAEIVPLGDMNAHIQDLDGYTDNNGKLMLDLCEQHNLVIVNTGPKCEGQITWEVGNRQSTIDYCLMTEGIQDKLREMVIDEEGFSSIGSDHKRIILKMGYVVGKESDDSKMASPNLNAEQIANIVTRVEEEIGKSPSKGWEYGELLSVVTTEIRKEKQHVHWKGKKKPKSWWNKEIREAIAERQKASREHRQAKKAQLPQDEVTASRMVLIFDHHFGLYCLWTYKSPVNVSPQRQNPRKEDGQKRDYWFASCPRQAIRSSTDTIITTVRRTRSDAARTTKAGIASHAVQVDCRSIGTALQARCLTYMCKCASVHRASTKLTFPNSLSFPGFS